MKDEKEELIYFLRYYYHDVEFVHFKELLQKVSLEELERKLKQPLNELKNHETLQDKFQYLNDNFILLVRNIASQNDAFDFNSSYLLNLHTEEIVLMSDNYHRKPNNNIILMTLV